MMVNNYVQRAFLLFIGLTLMISCKTITGGISTSDPSDIPYHMAKTKKNTRAYWQFIKRYPESRHVEKAKVKLAEMLIKDKKKEELLKYVRQFPENKRLVSGVLKKIEIMDQMKKHFMTHIQNGGRVVVRPGEVIYLHGYLKAYAGFQAEPEELEELDESEADDATEDIDKPDYEIKLEALHTPKFIKLELLADKSFVMVEKFNALVNIYCKVTVFPDAPSGVYHPTAIFGAYQKVSPDEEYRKGGKEISLTIEVVEHPMDSLSLLEVDFEAVKYFRQKQEKMQKAVNGLHVPNVHAFGTRYMYKYNLENYTLRIAEYKAIQAQACHHLQQVAARAAPAIASAAQAYIDKLRDNKLFVEYKPVNEPNVPATEEE